MSEMRLYHSTASQPQLLTARKHAPIHTHGRCITPQNDYNTFDAPYIADNGEWIVAKNDDEEWDPDAWLDYLDDVASRAYRPDFAVLPDVFKDAEATLARSEKWVDDVHERSLRPAVAIQPGLPIDEQVERAADMGAGVVFVGGSDEFKRTFGADIVAAAHEHGLLAHMARPCGEDGLMRAFRWGYDSIDTSAIVMHQNWSWLDALEAESRGDREPLDAADAADGDASQSTVEDWARGGDS